MAIVYQHRELDTGNVFYIGISAKGIKRAYKASNRSKFWKRVVERHGIIVDILFKDIPIEEAIQIEKYLISYYGKRYDGTGILCNFTDGGEGGSLGFIQSEETREKKRQVNYRRTYKKGIFKHTEKSKQVISDKLKEKWKDPVFKAEALSKRTSYERTEEHKRKVSICKSKPVLQYSLGGEYIAEYNSMVEAARAVGGRASHISNVCKGKRKKHKGFKWYKKI